MPEPKTQQVTVEGRRLRLSSLDKVMYPSTETTKGEVLNYYARISPYLLPLLAERPVTRVRYPHGTADLSFFEKNLPSGAPSWVAHTDFDEMTYPFVPDLATLQRDWVRPRLQLQPIPDTAALYDDYYRVYRNLYEAAKPELHTLARLGRSTSA